MRKEPSDCNGNDQRGEIGFAVIWKLQIFGLIRPNQLRINTLVLSSKLMYLGSLKERRNTFFKMTGKILVLVDANLYPSDKITTANRGKCLFLYLQLGALFGCSFNVKLHIFASTNIFHSHFKINHIVCTDVVTNSCFEDFRMRDRIWGKLNECLYQGSLNCRDGLIAKLNFWVMWKDSISFITHSTTNKYRKPQVSFCLLLFIS